MNATITRSLVLFAPLLLAAAAIGRRQPALPAPVISPLFAVAGATVFDTTAGVSDITQLPSGAIIENQPALDVYQTSMESLRRGAVLGRLVNHSAIASTEFPVAANETVYLISGQDAAGRINASYVSARTGAVLRVSPMEVETHSHHQWLQSVARWRSNPLAGDTRMKPWLTCVGWGCCKVDDPPIQQAVGAGGTK